MWLLIPNYMYDQSFVNLAWTSSSPPSCGWCSPSFHVAAPEETLISTSSLSREREREWSGGTISRSFPPILISPAAPSRSPMGLSYSSYGGSETSVIGEGCHLSNPRGSSFYRTPCWLRSSCRSLVSSQLMLPFVSSIWWVDSKSSKSIDCVDSNAHHIQSGRCSGLSDIHVAILIWHVVWLQPILTVDLLNAHFLRWQR